VPDNKTLLGTLEPSAGAFPPTAAAEVPFINVEPVYTPQQLALDASHVANCPGCGRRIALSGDDLSHPIKCFACGTPFYPNVGLAVPSANASAATTPDGDGPVVSMAGAVDAEDTTLVIGSGDDGAVIRYKCPHCGKSMKSLPSSAGRNGRCPRCFRQVTIPSPAPPARLHPSPSPPPPADMVLSAVPARPPIPVPVPTDDRAMRQWAMFMHLSLLAGNVVPIAGLVQRHAKELGCC
jgi:hypothetical protein